MNLLFIFKQILHSDFFYVFIIFAMTAIFCLMVAMFLMTLVFRLKNINKEEVWSRLEKKWRDPLLDTLSGTVPKEKMLKLVDKDEQLYWLDFLVRYAKRLTGSELEIARSLAEPYLGTIEKRLRLYEDAEYQARGIRTLSILGGDKYLDVISNGITHESPLVVMIASRELADKNRPEHCREIFNSLENYINWDHHFLSTMLSNLGEEFSESLRLKLLDEKTSEDLKTVIARSLIKLGDRKSVRTAVEMLKKEINVKLVNSAIYMVNILGTAEELEVVRPFTNHYTPSVRVSALRAIANLSLEDETDLFTRMYEDPDPNVILALMEVLVNREEEKLLRKFSAGESSKAQLAKEALKGIGI